MPIEKIADALPLSKDPARHDQATKGTVFDSSKVVVIYVLGGPGAGSMTPRETKSDYR